MICGPCLARLFSASRPSIRTSLRYSSTTSSRLDELIIHDTPRSTRKPKRVVRKRSAEVQAKLFDLYRARLAVSENIGPLSTTTQTADDAEVTEELDKRGKEYLNKELTAEQYKALKSKLSDAFLNQQLKSYCKSKGFEGLTDGTKSKLLSFILTQLWNVRQTKMTSSDQDTANGLRLSLGRTNFHFLTRSSRSPIHDEAGQILHNIEVDSQGQTIILKMPKKERDFFQQTIGTFTNSITTMTESFGFCPDEKTVKSIEKATNTMIEQCGKDEIRIHHLSKDEHLAYEAIRLLHSCATLTQDCKDVWALVQSGETHESLCQPVRPRPCEADIEWYRTVASSLGSTMPAYIVSDNDFRPTFERSVNRGVSVPGLRADDRFRVANAEATTTLQDIIADKLRKESGTTTITFGHALSSADSTLKTFSTDIPRLFSVVSSLQGLTETSSYNLLFESCQRHHPESLKIAVSGKFETSEALTFVVTRTTTESIVLRLPNHAADLQLSSQTSLPVSEEDHFKIRRYLEASRFTQTSNDVRLLPGLTLSSLSMEMSETDFRFMGIESVRQVSARHGPIHPVWIMSRGSSCLGTRQELCLVVDKQADTETLCGAIGRYISLLDK